MSLKVENVTKCYGTQTALDNVSFTVNSGEITAFLGPNGAGKSTLMKIITGFIAPNSGNIFVNDINTSQNQLEINRQIGYLPEHNPLYLEMYVKEYLNFTAEIYKIKNKSNQIKEIIEQTGLTLEQHKKIGALSKGYRQRVGLAASLIHNPSLLILDEPTTGLDPNQIIEIRQLISKVGKDKTVLLSTHIMQEVEAICSRVVVINKGKIVANNNVSEIKNIKIAKEKVVVVEFLEKVNITDLKLIDEVTEVVQVTESKFLLKSETENDIRANIFNYAVNSKLTVLSMQLQENNMEDVFRELTQTKK